MTLPNLNNFALNIKAPLMLPPQQMKKGKKEKKK